MRRIVTFLACVLMLSGAAVGKPRVVFFGDSITEMGARPGGYIPRLHESLQAQGISAQLIGAGIGGNKIYDLYLRLEDDVLSKDPQVVVLYVGVNDVWHKSTGGTGTDYDKFEKFYVALLKKLEARHIRFVLCTPAVIGERVNNTNPQDGDLNLYSQLIRDLAVRFKCPLADLRKEFQAYNQKNNTANLDKGPLTGDGVHLNDKGNQIVAESIARQLAPLLK